jgi:peptidoglycan/LPS O-acetylase OafA/YrhL
MSIEKVGPKDYMPALDGLRGFACLLVVVSHVCAVLHLSFEPIKYVIGSSGVILFFSLSGFLMGSLYIRKAFALESAGKYVIARFARITPAYYIAITFCLLLPFIIANTDYAMDMMMAIRSYAFMGSHEVFWSIPPEVQFYGYFLFVWLAYDRMQKGNYIPMGIMIALSIVLIASRDLWGGILLPSKLHIFLGGVVAAVLLHHPKVAVITRNVAFQFFMAVALTAYIIIFITKDNLYHDLFLAVLAAVTVMSFSSSSKVTAIFETNTLRVMGAASFSIYLFHDMILHSFRTLGVFEHFPLFVNIFICSVVAVSIPVAFHYLVERHLNKMSKDKGTDLFDRVHTHFLPRFFKKRFSEAS